MTGTRDLAALAELLEAAGAAHHVAFEAVGGADDDWADWYAGWLLDDGRLAAHLDAVPERAALGAALSRLADDHAATADPAPWPDHYARGLADQLRPS